MKKLLTIFILSILNVYLGWTQKDSTVVIKSTEIKTYEAKNENGKLKKVKLFSPSFFGKNYDRFPISIPTNTNKKYNRKGLLIEVSYPQHSISYIINYNGNNQLFQIFKSDLEDKDSLIMELKYDSKGNFEKFSIDALGLMRYNFPWIIGNILKGKPYARPSRFSEYQNYYLTSNDNITNQTIKKDFEEMVIEYDKLYNLYDSKNNLVIQREMTVENAYRGTLHPKRMDTTMIRKEYKYGNHTKIIELITKYDCNRKNLGGPKSSVKIYNYDSKDRIKEVLDTVVYYPLKAGLSSIKERTLVKKEIHEYLNNGLEHMVSYYKQNGKLDKKVIERFDSDGELKEHITEQFNRKSISKYNKFGVIVSYVRQKRKGKKIYDLSLDYVYNENADWIQCFIYDNLKDKPLFIQERVIQYY